MKFRVKAKETWLWDMGIEAESKEAIEAEIKEGFVDFFDCNDCSDLVQDWTIEEVKDEHT